MVESVSVRRQQPLDHGRAVHQNRVNAPAEPDSRKLEVGRCDGVRHRVDPVEIVALLRNKPASHGPSDGSGVWSAAGSAYGLVDNLLSHVSELSVFVLADSAQPF